MNLLNNVFNIDDIEIVKTNRRYLLILIISLIIIVCLLLIKHDVYYQNSYRIGDEQIVLYSSKEYVRDIQNASEIMINDIKYDYSINNIESVDDYFFISISLNNELIDNNSLVYKINIGKERLFEYLIRIIIK